MPQPQAFSIPHPTRVLSAKEKFLRALVEHGGDVFALLAADGTIGYASPVITRILGHPLDEFIGCNVLELLHPLDGQPTDEWFASLVRHPGTVARGQWRCRHRDGSWRWVEGTGINLLAEPDVKAIVFHFRDITEWPLAQEECARLAAIVESSEDAIIGKTLDGIITSWNAGAERLYGYAAGEAIGRSIGILFPADRGHELSGILERLKRGERIKPFETVRVGKDGSHNPVSVSISPVKNEAGALAGASVIARDITERKRLEEELSRRGAELAETDRRKDDFLAALGHELRNALATIPNALHILSRPGVDRRTVTWAQEVIGRQARHLSRLVDDLLDVSRIQRGRMTLHPERLDLCRLVCATAEDYRSALEGAGLSLTLELPPEAVWVMGDPTRLTEVLGNLLANGIKFTDPGGRVTVRIGLAGEGRDAMVTVRDTGAGMAPDQLPYLFQAFAQEPRTLDRNRGGLGLGLALVKGLVELHGGRVAAASEGPGRGAEFSFCLPRVVEPAIPAGTPPAVGPVGSSRVDLQACKLEYSIVSPK